MQLAAFLPLYNFTFLPFMYDVMKPWQIAHLILTEKSYILTDMEGDYFNRNYVRTGLNVAKLGQSLFLQIMVLVILVIINIIYVIVHSLVPKNWTFSDVARRGVKQFRYNAYIRWYMLAYFDLTFFSIMKILEGNVETYNRFLAQMASYVIVCFNAVVPLFVFYVIFSRKDLYKIKKAKEVFSTIMIKIDKNHWSRFFPPVYFFVRRFSQAIIMSIPLDHDMIFIQFIAVLATSHTYLIYLFSI